jgi:lipoprotein LprG
LTVGCSGSDEAQVKGSSASEQLAAAKAKVDAATSLHLTLRSSGIPESASGVLGADGSGTHAPAFKGTLDARISGFEAKVEVVAVDNVLYLKLPFTTEFVQADPKEYNAPDPARLFAREGGISSLLTATTNPVEGKKLRVGPDVVQTITGTLPGASVSRLLGVGDATKTFDVTYGITVPGGELRTVTMTGPFFKGATPTPATSTAATPTPATPTPATPTPATPTPAASESATSGTASSTYVLTLDKYGAPVEISKP